MKTILLLAFSGACFAGPISQIKTLLNSDNYNDRTEAVTELNKIIDDLKLSNEDRLEALQLAADMKVHESSIIIIKYIDTHWTRGKSAMSFEELFPSVNVLIAIGDKAVPGLIEAIKSEDNELRHRLMSYSLGRIMKRDAALAHIQKLIDADMSAAEKNRLEAAKTEISKWSDYEAPEK